MTQKAVVVFSNIPEEATGQDVLLTLRQLLEDLESETSQIMRPTTVFVENELYQDRVIILSETFSDNETVLIFGRKPRKKRFGIKGGG